MKKIRDYLRSIRIQHRPSLRVLLIFHPFRQPVLMNNRILLSFQIPDISTRRRLSTPKSSPALPKRSPSQKSYKSSTTSDPQPQQSGKLSWFKSLDRLSRKKDKTATLPPSSSRTTSVDDRFNGQQTLKSTRMAMQQEQPQSKGNSSKTLRFFGDTDLESNAGYSKASWKNK